MILITENQVTLFLRNRTLPRNYRIIIVLSNVVSDLVHLMELIDLTLFVRFATKTATMPLLYFL